MTEYLAIPATGTPATSLDQWVQRLAELGHAAKTVREGPAGAWIEVAALRLRGYAVFEGNSLDAINFEVQDPTASASLALIESAAMGLGWEIHADEGEEDDD